MKPAALAPDRRGVRDVVVVSINGPEWRWFADRVADESLHFHFVSTFPASALERWTKRHVFTQMAAGWRAARLARRLCVQLVICVDPRTLLWYSLAASLLRFRTNCIAYGFNFAALPSGVRRVVMTRAFRRASRLIVFSMAEIPLYAHYFGIPAHRFDMVFWSARRPVLPASAATGNEEYVCAIGGNGRDYRTLLEAASRTPEIAYRLIARPENVDADRLPLNVRVDCNVPLHETMEVLANARFMVLPLKGQDVPCGHVTIVSAMHLGLATIVSASSGIEDYTDAGSNAVRVPVGDAVAMAAAIRKLWNDPDAAARLGENAKRFAELNCSEEVASNHFVRMLNEAGVLDRANPSAPP